MTIQRSATTALAVLVAVLASCGGGTPGDAAADAGPDAAPPVCGLCQHVEGTACVATTAGWDQRVVDPRTAVADAGEGATSLAIDGAGHPVIAYGGALAGGLRLATYVGPGWTIEDVDRTSGGAGDGVLLALAPDGTPHLAYLDFPVNDWVLRHAARVGGGWQVEPILHGLGDHPAALAVDAEGQPHLAYWYTEPDAPFGTYIDVGVRSGAGWTTAMVPPPAALTWGAAVAFDAGLELHAAGNDDGLTYAAHSAAGWTASTVTSSLPHLATYHVALTIDGAGRPHILSTLGSEDLRYAEGKGAGWSDGYVDGGKGLLPEFDSPPVIDAQGAAHVAYLVGDPAELRYARLAGAGWQKQPLAVSGTAAAPSVAADASGRPFVAYLDRGAGEGGANALELAVECRP